MKPQVRKTALAKLRPTGRYDNRAIAPALVLGGIALIGALFGKNFIGAIAKEGVYRFAIGMAWFLKQLIPIVNQIFLWLGGVAANLINIFSIMNPFDATTMAPFLWNTFKNIAYVVLIFLSLYAGFKYIIGNDREAKNVIFKILVIALLINFSFLIAKEVFLVSHVVTNNLACLYGESTVGKSPPGLLDRFLDNETKKTVCNQIGTAIHTSLLAFMQNTREGANAAAIQLTANTDDQLLRTVYDVMAQMMILVLFFIYTIMMFIFAGLFVGRFVMITFLAGLLPVAVIMWALPGKENTWKTWLSNFLTWTYNIPLLLILVLVGFSVVSIGLGAPNTGDNFVQTLAALTDPRVINANPLSKDDQNSIQLYAGLIRFFFIVVYYGFAISFAQSMGGNAAKFSVQLATGAYLGLGAATVAGGKQVFAPVRQTVGSGLEKAGGGITSWAAGKPIIGGWAGALGRTISGTGKGITKSAAEAKKEEAGIIWDKLENEPEKAIERIIKGDRLAVELAGVVTEKLSAEQIVRATRGIKKEDLVKLVGKDANKAVKKIFDKKFEEAFTTTKTSDISEFIASRNQAKFDYVGFSELLEAADRSALFKPALSQAFVGFGREKRKSFGSNITAMQFADVLGLNPSAPPGTPEKQEYDDYIAGVKRTPQVRTLHRDLLPKESYALQLEITTAINKLDPAINPIPKFSDFLASFRDKVLGLPTPTDTTKVVGRIRNLATSAILNDLKNNKYSEAREKILKMPDGPNKDILLRSMDYLDLAKDLKIDLRGAWS